MSLWLIEGNIGQEFKSADEECREKIGFWISYREKT